MSNNPAPQIVNERVLYRHGKSIQIAPGLACPRCGIIARNCDVQLIRRGLRLDCRSCFTVLVLAEPAS